MKEMIICISMGLIGHLIVFRGIDPPSLVHNLALWSVVGISLGIFSFLHHRLLQPVKRLYQSVSQRGALSRLPK